MTEPSPLPDLIVAASYAEAINHAITLGLRAHQWRYVSSAGNLLAGYREPHLIFAPDWRAGWPMSARQELYQHIVMTRATVAPSHDPEDRQVAAAHGWRMAP